MDPITLIVAAVVAGASTGATDVAAAAVKDLYSGLKHMLVGLFEDKGEKAAADQLKADNVSKHELASAIERIGAQQDEKVLMNAKALLEAADPAGAEAGKYTVTTHDQSMIGNVGPHGT